MPSSLLQLLNFFDDDDLMETQPRNYPNRGGVAPRRSATVTKLPGAAVNNTGKQNMKGLINNTGYTMGNGNGSIIFGAFDSTTRTYTK
ncbi:hypothetical protein Lal_00011059 [Lupinus albus]|uniref:Uncharacterized protein n=1 Tax=Lupinus albus TaxID=3870 RepID=A0A6A4PS61_LUPAL|nr:hypothetical protein Lalb_Chr11g0072421 [Lupinus albus]KAF1892592.1 hypothetical protein Lal_00011059 [Lupinus albus]